MPLQPEVREQRRAFLQRQPVVGVRVGAQLEVVEVPRVPASTDVMASYQLTLDGDGNVVRYRRARRYYR